MKPFLRARKESVGDELSWFSALMVRLDERRPLMIKIGIIVCLLIITLGVTLLVSLAGPLYGMVLMAIPFAIAFVLIMEKHLQFSPLIILFAAAFIPFSLPTGTGSRLVMSLVLALLFIFLWLLRMGIVEKHIHIERSQANWPVFGFIIVTLISVVWSYIFRDPLVYLWRTYYFVQAASTIVMILSPALLIFIGNVIQDVKRAREMVWLMMALGVIGLAGKFLNVTLPTNTEGLASMWVISLAVSLALFDRGMKTIFRGMLLLLAGLWVFRGFVLNISWVAGWLPGMVAGVVILFLRSKKLLLLATAVLAIYIAFNVSVVEQWFGDEREISGDTRLTAWKFNWKYTSQHLLFGMGPAGYAAYYMTYNPFEGMATHSNYIDILAQTGVVGSAFYLAIFGVLAWRGLVVYQRVKKWSDFLEGLIVGLLGGLAGCVVIMGFGDWLIPFAYTQTIMGFSYSVYSWLFLGLIISLDLITARWLKKSEPA
jgi:O-antigen ligase